jgi:uncharacterized membrane protein
VIAETAMPIIDEGSRKDAEADGWDSLYVSLIPLPAAFMLATLISDGVYWLTAGPFWSRASEWLLGAGLATGAIAAAQALILYVSLGRLRPSRTCWTHVVGHLLALLLSLSNLVYRLNEDVGRAVVPAGISLTAIAAFLLLFTARLGRGPAPRAPWDDGDDAEFG